jgi:hypothetical protein
MRNWKDSPGRVKRAKTFRQIRAGIARAKLWKERWELYPDSMRANLDKINGTRKEDAAKRTERLITFAKTLPSKIQAGNVRQEIGKSLAAFGHRNEKPDIERILSAMRRRSMLRFDNVALVWMVALDC